MSHPQQVAPLADAAEQRDGPHTVQLVHWDVPLAAGAGERFTFAVGAKCEAGCALRGQMLCVVDDTGATVATARLGSDILPGTEALYFAEIEATAPPIAGSHRWEVRTVDWQLPVPHAASGAPMALNVVSAPDCVVTVKTVVAAHLTPVSGARVVMHPYRAMTDEAGIARLRVARGTYDLLVSGRQMMPSSTSIEVGADSAITIELEADQPTEEWA